MTCHSNYLLRYGIAAMLLSAGLAVAQDQPPVSPQNPAQSSGGWRRVGDAPPAQQTGAPPAQAEPTEPVDRSADAYGQGAQEAAPPQTLPARAPQVSSRPAYGVPSQLTLKPGTFFTVRTNTMLQSNKNKEGDLFTATLTQPLVSDGIVVAQRGQTVVGRVAETGKGKDGIHRIRLELTGITLADGSQIPVQSQLATSQGRTTPAGVQAGTVVGTTAVGAGIGAIAARGTGAAIGAGVGALAGIAGVIATRDHPAVVYPETPLTFQLTSPVNVSTVNAPQAFRYVGPEDYDRQPALASRAPMRPAYPPANYLYGPGYYYPGYPYYGPSIGIGFGFGYPRYYGRRWR